MLRNVLLGITLFFGFFENVGFAAKIKKVYRSKHQIIVNKGKKHDVSIGDEVCVFPKNQLRFSCGKVVKLKKLRALVNIDTRMLRKGMQAHIVTDNIAVDTAEKNERNLKDEPVYRNNYGDFISAPARR